MSKSGFRKLLDNFTCEKVSPGWIHERDQERLYLIMDGRFCFLDETHKKNFKLDPEKKVLNKVLRSKNLVPINVRKNV